LKIKISSENKVEKKQYTERSDIVNVSN
jgi:hypothetical protein